MAYPNVAMAIPFKPRRRFSNHRLRFFAAALIVGLLIYYYGFRSTTTFDGWMEDLKLAEVNSTLGVSLTLSCDPSR
jgi:hypothetical protein